MPLQVRHTVRLEMACAPMLAQRPAKCEKADRNQRTPKPDGMCVCEPRDDWDPLSCPTGCAHAADRSGLRLVRAGRGAAAQAPSARGAGRGRRVTRCGCSDAACWASETGFDAVGTRERFAWRKLYEFPQLASHLGRGQLHLVEQLHPPDGKLALEGGPSRRATGRRSACIPHGRGTRGRPSN